MTESGLEKFWSGIVAVPLAQHVGNAAAELDSIQVGDTSVPIALHTSRPGQTNLCSLHVHFIEYAREEANRLPDLSAPARLFVRGGLKVLERLGDACALEHVVTVNNLLLTTCLHPLYPSSAAARATRELSRRFPERAIVWRSVATELNAALIAELREAGATLLPWRSVFLSSPETLRTALRDSRDAHRDAALARRPNGDYCWNEGNEFTAADWMRAADLYQQLYVQKYSHYNPDYTAAFFRWSHDSGAMQMFGLRAPEGRLDGVVGIYRRAGVQAAPLLGYDTALPRKLGLYRTLCAKHWLEAMNANCWAHQSAGVATFKKNRRAEAAVEYVAVFTRHLPRRRRFAWAIFTTVVRQVALPITRRFER